MSASANKIKVAVRVRPFNKRGESRGVGRSRDHFDASLTVHGVDGRAPLALVQCILLGL